MPFAEGQSDEGAIVIAHPLMNDGMLDKRHRYARDAERAYDRAVREFQQYRKLQPEPQPQPAAPIRNKPNLNVRGPQEPRPSGSGTMARHAESPQDSTDL